MSRPLRIEFPGAFYHVTSRGDGREDIYLNEENRKRFLNVLEHLQERFNWLVHVKIKGSNKGVKSAVGF